MSTYAYGYGSAASRYRPSAVGGAGRMRTLGASPKAQQQAPASSLAQLGAMLVGAGKKDFSPDSYLAAIHTLPTANAHGDGTAAGFAGSGTHALPLNVDKSMPTLAPLTGAGDYSSDPILQQIIATQQAQLIGARTDAKQQQRDLVLNLGSPELAAAVLGKNDAALGLVSQDPDKSLSTFARIQHDYLNSVSGANEDLNANNLFYSGYRGKTLNDLARQDTVAKNDATASVQQTLAQVNREEKAAENAYMNAVMSANQDAYMRALAAQLAAAQLKTAPTAPTDVSFGTPIVGHGADFVTDDPYYYQKKKNTTDYNERLGY